ncbi:MAG: hypothetical protein SA378_09630 [Sedimentibacter sp.]|uniref:hypothetical protein n=1 Tax=Sedimentibacter sp. TaxID=1960295 RepID=UPI0029820AC2|nr:hypothetical protein [Sedimentibacter sp.]MDW5300383.1 hypothetical protein [Sedimentibacter sp.]
MEGNEYNVEAEAEAYSADENSTQAEQNKNILKEMIDLEQKMKDTNNHAFKKTTYWNKINNTQDNQDKETLFKEIMDVLLRIEFKLTQIETLLTK